MQLSQRTAVLALVLGLSLATGTVYAESDRPDHYQGIAATTVEQAHANLVTYNAKLEQLIESELTAEVMGEIHQITYTLENALQQMETGASTIADDLEALHLASERNNTAEAPELVQIYLQEAEKLGLK